MNIVKSPMQSMCANLFKSFRQHVQACSIPSVMSDTLQPNGLQPSRLLCVWDSPGKNTGVGCHALLQGIFLTSKWLLVSADFLISSSGWGGDEVCWILEPPWKARIKPWGALSQASNSRSRWEVGRRKGEGRDPELSQYWSSREMHPCWCRVEYF